MRTNPILNEILDQLCPEKAEPVSFSVRGTSFSFVPDVNQRASTWESSKIPVEYSGTYAMIRGGTALELSTRCRAINGKAPDVIFGESLNDNALEFKKAYDGRGDITPGAMEAMLKDYLETQTWEHLYEFFNNLPSVILDNIHETYVEKVLKPWRSKAQSFFDSSTAKPPAVTPSGQTSTK